MFSEEILYESRLLGQQLTNAQLRIGTAESCTGGLVAAAITEIAGSSGWFDEGLVTYANHSKQRLLGVPEQVLATDGAVSQAAVEAMVAGVIARGASVAVATSGVAGPGGGSPEKPVGTVWLAWHVHSQIISRCVLLAGDRQAIRAQTTYIAIRGVNQLLAGIEPDNFTV